MDKLNEIAVIVGIISTVSAWPILKSTRNWLKEQQHKKLVRMAKVITDANKPFIAVYEREYTAVERVDEIINQDLVVFEFGVNDLHYGRLLGQFGDTDTSKFYSALDFVYNKLITDNPTAKFVIITPMKNRVYKTAPDSFTQNSAGLYQLDYVNAIKQVADKYLLPVLDMYANSDISAMNETHNQMYLFDGLYPNQEGSFIVASKVIRFINS